MQKLAPEGSITVIIQGDIPPADTVFSITLPRLRYAGVQQHPAET